jgi:DNA-binding PadR family transcriptional regulator
VLALRDHSTYDLTKQMRYSLHYLWPRAESNVYAEPRRLVEAGLASAREEWVGDRRRTVYAITRAGRKALAAWLAMPSSRQRYESEALLKILFAENGTREDLLSSIRALRDDAQEALIHWQEVADSYEAGGGEYPERFALSSLVARLLGEQDAATIRWAEWAERVVDGWDASSVDDPAFGISAVRSIGHTS